MGLRYSADLDLAADVLARLGDVEATLDDVVHDLRWRVQRMPEVFEGVAAVAFLERHQRWEASYDDMRVALSTMRASLRTARSNYRRAVDANVSLWRSVQ